MKISYQVSERHGAFKGLISETAKRITLLKVLSFNFLKEAQIIPDLVRGAYDECSRFLSKGHRSHFL